MKTLKLFLVIIFFAPLVLSGQIQYSIPDKWRVLSVPQGFEKFYSRIVKDTFYTPVATYPITPAPDRSSQLIGFKKTTQDENFIVLGKKFSKPMKTPTSVGIAIEILNADPKNSNTFFGVRFNLFHGDTVVTINSWIGWQTDMSGSFIEGILPLIDSTKKGMPKEVDSVTVNIGFFYRTTGTIELLFDRLMFLYLGDPTARLVDDFGDPTIVSVKDENSEIPNSFKLFQNYPNPFNPTTSIKYEVSSIMNVKLVVYDILGKEVATLVNEEKLPGSYEIQFNGSNLPSAQGGLASGTYFYRLQSGSLSQTKKFVLMK